MLIVPAAFVCTQSYVTHQFLQFAVVSKQHSPLPSIWYGHLYTCPLDILAKLSLFLPYPSCRPAQAGKYDAAKEGLLKLEDIAGLLQLNVDEERWDDAFLLQAAHSQLKEQVYIPYAKWLLSRDRCATGCSGSALGWCLCKMYHSIVLSTRQIESADLICRMSCV